MVKKTTSKKVSAAKTRKKTVKLKSDNPAQATSAKPVKKASRPAPSQAAVEAVSAVPQEKAHVETADPITLQASRRFWLGFIGIAALVAVLIQGYGYFTGWGNPDNVIQRRFNTAQRLTLAKRYSAALKQYQKIVDQAKDGEIKRQASIAMADLYREQKDWTQAIHMYEQLQGQDDGTVMSAWTGLKIAECLNEAGQSDRALATFGKIRGQFPKSDWDAEARLGMGKVYMDQEKYNEAIAVYRTLEQDYQGGFLAAEALVNIGQCQSKMGDTETARATFQSVVDTYPDTMTDEAKKYLKRLDGKGKPEGVSLWGE